MRAKLRLTCKCGEKYVLMGTLEQSKGKITRVQVLMQKCTCGISAKEFTVEVLEKYNTNTAERLLK